MTPAKSEFAFRETTDVTLKHVNLHKVFHGDEHVQAVELTMALDLPNSALDVIQPGLRQALYYNAKAIPGQESIDGETDPLPNLRFPRLNGNKFKLDDKKNKMAGYDLFVEYGLGDERSSMVFDCCKVTNRAIETKEGGTVLLTWQVQYNGDRLDKDTCGKLALLSQDLIAIRLIPPVVSSEPEPEEKPKNPLYMGEDEDEDEGGAGQTAEDLFLAGAGEPSDEQRQTETLESDAR